MQMAVATFVLATMAWVVATNFVRVEVRVFGAEIPIRLGWALTIALAVGIAIGFAFARSTGRRR